MSHVVASVEKADGTFEEEIAEISPTLRRVA
ncbi:hypothetical protein BH09MYX1_BH09MYX1_00620 [soil metagenome]